MSPGEYCDVLVTDFFSFAEGRLEEMRLMKVDEPHVKVGDLGQMSRVLAAGKQLWLRYCEWYRLPRECKQLFITKLKKQWKSIGEIQNHAAVQETLLRN